MKRILYVTFIFILYQSCSNTVVLTNRTFVTNNPYKIDELEFVNDSICIYEQVFLCDIDDDYKETRTYCTYKINKRNIILTNSDTTVYTTCIRLPKTELEKCFSTYNELSNQKIIRLGESEKFSDADAYGYIDIITIDTLEYKGKTICHNKWNYCTQFPIYTSLSFYEEKGRKKY